MNCLMSFYSNIGPSDDVVTDAAHEPSWWALLGTTSHILLGFFPHDTREKNGNRLDKMKRRKINKKRTLIAAMLTGQEAVLHPSQNESQQPPTSDHRSIGVFSIVRLMDIETWRPQSTNTVHRSAEISKLLADFRWPFWLTDFVWQEKTVEKDGRDETVGLRWDGQQDEGNRRERTAPNPIGWVGAFVWALHTQALLAAKITDQYDCCCIPSYLLFNWMNGKQHTFTWPVRLLLFVCNERSVSHKDAITVLGDRTVDDVYTFSSDFLLR